MINLGIFAKTYSRPTLDDILTQMCADGMRYTQFNMACMGLSSMPDEISDAVIANVQANFAKHNVEMVAVSGTFNMIHPDQQVVEDGMRRLDVLAQAAHALGTNQITLCTGTRDPEDKWRHHPDNSTAQAWEDLLASMTQALALADKYDVTLGIEPEKANVIDSAEKARQLLDHFATPRLKIILDPANLFEQATSAEANHLLDTACDLLGADIVIAHAKDRDKAGNFVAAGQGMLDYEHYITQLHALNFAGPLILHGLSETEVADCVHFVRKYL